MSKNVIYTALAVILMAVILGFFYYNAGHGTLENKDPDYVVSATELYNTFSTDEEYANEIYLKKIIEVVGILERKEVNQDKSVNLVISSGNPMGNVICTFTDTEDLNSISSQEGRSITVKGICSGMLMDVLLNNCVLVEN